MGARAKLISRVWRGGFLLGISLGISPLAGAADCTPASVRRAFGEDRPPALLHVAEIPPGVMDAFWRAYGGSDPTRRIADPGERFQESDVVEGNLPWRRLVAAAASPRAAWLLYEKGGRAKTQQLFVVCLADGKAVGAYSAVRAPAGYTPAELAPAMRGGCLVSPPREYWQPGDEERCPAPAKPEER